MLGVLNAGRHRRRSHGHVVYVLDTRPTVEILPTQEVPTADGVSVKITVAVLVHIADPERFVFGATSAHSVLYLAIQVALREAVATRSVDDLLTGRRAFGEAVLDTLLAGDAPAGSAVGLAIDELSIKDLILPTELRLANAAVLVARAEGLAALERARSESASLRSLTNAAKLVAAEPALLQLRTLQEVGRSTGHTVVLGALPGLSLVL